jgi:hypothetical protein
MLPDSTTRRPEKPRPPKAVIAARKAEIARRYDAKRSPFDLDKLIAGKRRNEIETLIRYRYGSLPDTDDRDVLLRFWAAHNQRSAQPQEALIELARRLGAHLSEAEAESVVSYVAHFPRRYKAQTLGKLLQLTEAEREACAITTIVACDVTPAQRKVIRKAKRAARVRRGRRAKGMQPRQQYLAAALSQIKPWEAEGVSRRTWFRRRKASQECGGTGLCPPTWGVVAWAHTCATSPAELPHAVAAGLFAPAPPVPAAVPLTGEQTVVAGLVPLAQGRPCGTGMGVARLRSTRGLRGVAMLRPSAGQAVGPRHGAASCRGRAQGRGRDDLRDRGAATPQ